jgi:hypothetical protein
MNKFAVVYDDLLSIEEANEYKEYFISNDFPWYLQKSTVTNGNDFQFMSHKFYGKDIHPSNWLSIPVQIIQKFIERTNSKYKDVIRIQSNLVHKTNFESHSSIHVDGDDPHYVLIYYVNNSDGDTIMFEEKKIVKRIEPKKGRFVLFDGSIYHAHFPCKENDTRIVINYNLTIPE